MTYRGAELSTCAESFECRLGGQDLSDVFQEAMRPPLPSAQARPTTLERLEDFLFSCLEQGGCLVNLILDPNDQSATLGLLEPR